MNNKEEFLAYLKQASQTVEKWPDWKKSGLNAPITVNKPNHESRKFVLHGSAAELAK
ncbi:hypothetical protein [Pectobacterium polaris]|uniref:hypothetical protein n=1 Tax=Pectobacterium polaris TaxID=2042057 RepID=UPI0024049D2B|nr:hypothetical protein [Pectobacterium polaris]MDG0803320.1 hypothetical protein [Pectobacterium polaris]